MKKLTLDRVVPTISAERLLADLGNYRLGHPFLTEVGKQQQDPRQPLLAGVEKLIHHPNIAGKKMMQ